MPDWKEMYLTLMRETEAAVRILTAAQRKCEEMYLEAEEPVLFVLPKTAENEAANGQGNANNS